MIECLNAEYYCEDVVLRNMKEINMKVTQTMFENKECKKALLYKFLISNVLNFQYVHGKL